jgi:translation initiation factor 3 subunit B
MTSSIRELVEERLEEDGDEDLLDYLSEGEDDQNEDIMEMDKSFPDTVFIGGLPKLNPEKSKKLESVVKSRYLDKYGTYDSVWLPIDSSTNMTRGMAIVKFTSVASAKQAVEQMHGVSLDKAHVLSVCKFDDFDKILARSEEFEPKSTIPRTSRKDHRDWLTDKRCREQFLMRHDQETQIFWHDNLAGEPELYYGGEREKDNGKIWCDWKVQFSPQGSFVATYHKPGIALWAGEKFQRWKCKFHHENVKFIDFSPTEDFLLTWNGSLPSQEDENAVKIFRVLTGECVWKTRTPTMSPNATANDNCVFPHFMWSKDGKYIAMMKVDTVYVRDTATFENIKDEGGQQRSLKYENLATFQWSPKDNIIALWTNEKDNNPARLLLVEIPSRKEIASRTRTQVECKMHWQSEGDYLCLLVTKLGKKLQKGSTNLEILRMREKNYPADTVEIKDCVVKAFHWETGSNRFGVITTDEAGHKPKLLMYALGPAKTEQIACIELPSPHFSHIYWAPGGQYFLCAAMGSNAGDLLFCALMPDNKLEVLAKDEHFMVTNVEWDPSSRYIITAVTQGMKDSDHTSGFKYQMHSGYAIWNFLGRKLVGEVQLEKLYGISWRPHPPSLLSSGTQEHIRKNIKQFSKKYDAKDEAEKDKARAEFNAERKQRKDAFLKILERIDDNKDARMEENGWLDAQEQFDAQFTWQKDERVAEEELDATEELIA